MAEPGDSSDWTSLTRRLAGDSTTPVTPEKEGRAGMIVGIVLGISVLSAAGATAAVLVNMLLISSFPNAAWLEPGIGYRNAFLITAIVLLVRALFVAATAAGRNSK